MFRKPIRMVTVGQWRFCLRFADEVRLPRGLFILLVWFRKVDDRGCGGPPRAVVPAEAAAPASGCDRRAARLPLLDGWELS